MSISTGNEIPKGSDSYIFVILGSRGWTTPRNGTSSCSVCSFADLVQLFAECDYDEARIRPDCPFLVQDVLFNALLCQANRDLAEVAGILGEDPSTFEKQAQKTARAIESKFWDEEHGIYLDFDLVAGRQIHVYVAPNFVPLFAGIPDEGRAKHMIETMENTGFGLGATDYYPVPSYDGYGF